MKKFESVSGAFSGFITTLPGTIAFGTIVYAPLGDEWLANGILVCLIAHIIAGAISAASGASKELIIGPRSFSAVIFSTVVGVVFIELTPTLGEAAAAKYAISCCVIVGVLSGFIQIILGIFQLGKIVQFIPAQVISSIMNVTAIMVLASQVPRALGISGSPWTMEFYGQISSSDINSIMLSLMTIAFMLGLPKTLMGIPSSLIALGFGIIVSFALENLITGFSVLKLPSINISTSFLVMGDPFDSFVKLPGSWSFFNSLFIASVSLACINTVGLLVAGKSINMDIDRVANQNRDLISGGGANMIISLIGSVPCTAKLGASKVAVSGNARGAQIAWLVSGFYALVVIFFLPYLNYIPIAVLAGISAVLAIRLIDNKAIDVIKGLRLSLPELRKTDYVYLITVISVLITAIIYDFTLAVLVGIFLTLLDFLIKISNFKVNAFTGEKIRSRTHRTIDEEKLLDDCMSELVILDISGFILFPVAEKLKDQVDEAVSSSCKYVIFDFHDVHYVDETGCLFILKILEELRRSGLEAIITQKDFKDNPWLLNTEWEKLITEFPDHARFHSLDNALLEVENKILKKFKSHPVSENLLITYDLFRGLTQIEFEIAFNYFNELTASPGELLHQGKDGSALFLIINGTVDVNIEPTEGIPFKLYTFKNGAIVGEITFLDDSKRSASVVCKTYTRFLKLMKINYHKLQTKEPLIAGKIMENIAIILAQRLRKTNDLIDQDL